MLFFTKPKRPRTVGHKKTENRVCGSTRNCGTKPLPPTIRPGSKKNVASKIPRPTSKSPNTCKTINERWSPHRRPQKAEHGHVNEGANINCRTYPSPDHRRRIKGRYFLERKSKPSCQRNKASIPKEAKNQPQGHQSRRCRLQSGIGFLGSPQSGNISSAGGECRVFSVLKGNHIRWWGWKRAGPGVPPPLKYRLKRA